MKIRYFVLFFVLFLILETFCYFYIFNNSLKLAESDARVFYFSLRDKIHKASSNEFEFLKELQISSYYIFFENQLEEISRLEKITPSFIKSVYTKDPPIYFDQSNFKGYFFYLLQIPGRKILLIVKDFFYFKEDFYKKFISVSIFITIFLLLLLYFVFENLKKSNEKIKVIKQILSQERTEIGLYKDPNLIELLELIDDRLNREKDISLYNEIFGNALNLIDEKVVIFNKDGKICFANDGFKEDFSVTGEGKNYWEIFQDKFFIDFIEKDAENQIKTKISGKVYLIKKNVVKNHTILYMKDITKIEDLENKKRELISYISHELKTPVTIIKGYIETSIEEMKEEKSKSYLTIALNHTDRLELLMKDLLTIVQLENKNFDLMKEKIKIKDIFEEMMELYSARLAEKEISVDENIIPENLEISANRTSLYVIFSNLFDNAIKHTSKGWIHISAVIEDNKCRIDFEDTGEGIAEEDLPYIFDEFYVGNKGRYKEKTGTGLGLSIVKKLISLHNGTIKVKSKQHIGTKFTIILPL